MKATIEAVKDEVAKKAKWENWKELWNDLFYNGKKMVGFASKNNEEMFEKFISESIELYHTRKCEEAGKELESELKDGDESLCAKLRNALSPHYGLPSAISKLRNNSEILKIVEDMSQQALKNNLRIDTLLRAIESQLQAKDKEITNLESIIDSNPEDVKFRFKGMQNDIENLESQLQEAKAEAKYAEEMRNLCAQQCGHKNKLILEICKERDEFKAEVERFSQFKKWIDEMIEKEEKGGDLSYRQHRVVYTQVKEKISQLNQHKTEGK